MKFWERLLSMGRGLFDISDDETELAVYSDCAPDPNDVGFTAAVIGLGAKLAKADGMVTDDEVSVFMSIFQTAPEDAASVRRVFDLARQTVRGYEGYARKIGRKYRNRACLLESVLDGLFRIAGADGVITSEELEYLNTVSDAFGFSETDFRRIKASHMGPEPSDPYAILGVSYDADFDSIRIAYRKLMADNHPDRLVMHGAPREFEAAAHDKAAAITSAYAKIRVERGLLVRPD
ncbi:MAG: molecular chaperone DjiA [Pseudomonadota bacterium]